MNWVIGFATGVIFAVAAWAWLSPWLTKRKARRTYMSFAGPTNHYGLEEGDRVVTTPQYVHDCMSQQRPSLRRRQIGTLIHFTYPSGLGPCGVIEFDGIEGRKSLALHWLMKYTGKPLHIKGHEVTSITLDDFQMPDDDDAGQE